MNMNTGGSEPGAPAQDALVAAAAERKAALDQRRGAAIADERFGAGLAAGLVAAVIGAAAWALVAFYSGYELGWLAIGIGFLVGMAIRVAGRGASNRFGVMGAVLSLASVLLGKFAAMIMVMSKELDMTISIIFQSFPFGALMQFYEGMFGAMDLLFIAIAVAQGYKLAFTDPAAA
jgi:hypothetical protein